MKDVITIDKYILKIITEGNLNILGKLIDTGELFESQKIEGINKMNVIKTYLDKKSEGKVRKYYIEESSEVIGLVSICEYRHREYELGYFLNKDHRGRGLMKLILKGLIDYIGRDYTYFCYTEKDNIQSVKTLKALGFNMYDYNNKIKAIYNES